MSEGYGDRFRQLEQAYDQYTVYDQHYEKVGKIDDIFVDEYDEPEYIGVKMGLLGTKSTLIPIELVRVNDRRQLIEIAADEETIKHAPTFDNDSDITPEYEDRVHGYFGLQRSPSMQSRGGYGGYYDSGSYPDEGLQRPAASTPSSRTSPPELDIPLEAERLEPQDYEQHTRTSEPSERPAASNEPRRIPASSEPRQVPTSNEPRRMPASSEPRRMPESQPSGAQVGGDSKVRIYKRARSGPR